MQAFQTKQGARHGFSLVEMLVVITILLAFGLVALPLFGQALDGRQTREAARELSAFIGGARARAIESGRPGGILLERLSPELPQAVLSVHMAEAPPPYAGDSMISRAVIKGDIGQGQITRLHSNDVTDVGWQGLVKHGDLLKINYQGRMYRVVANDPDDLDEDGFFIVEPPWNIVPVDIKTTSFVPSVPEPGLPFQIFRQPVKSSIPPLQLPAGSVIDLQFSGIDSLTNDDHSTFSAFFQNTDDEPNLSSVVIMFAADGSLESVRYGVDVPRRPSEPVYLMLGQRVKIGGDTDPDDPLVVFNYQDVTNYWVAIGHQAGRVTTTEVAATSTSATSIDSAVAPQDAIVVSRQFARQAQAMGGAR